MANCERQTKASLPPDKRGAAMTRHTYLFDMNDLFQARLESAQDAGGLSPGTERDQKRRIARCLKRPFESQI